VLAEHKRLKGKHTLKRWHSDKGAAEPEDGDWRHRRVVLESLNPDLPSITLTDGEGAKAIGEFVAAL